MADKCFGNSLTVGLSDQGNLQWVLRIQNIPGTFKAGEREEKTSLGYYIRMSWLCRDSCCWKENWELAIKRNGGWGVEQLWSESLDICFVTWHWGNGSSLPDKSKWKTSYKPVRIIHLSLRLALVYVTRAYSELYLKLQKIYSYRNWGVVSRV